MSKSIGAGGAPNIHHLADLRTDSRLIFPHGHVLHGRLEAPTEVAVSTTLPAPLSRFVGRETELAQAAALLASARLLTLTGPGGAGKTRLALRLASAVAGQFPNGVWFVDFSALSGSQFVWDQVATTLGVKEPGSGRSVAEAVGRYLARREALAVLDNCEHLVESASGVAAALLSAAPALKIIATSREPLGCDGEVTWAVPPLSEIDAVELFSDRARQAWPQFRLHGPNTKDVLYICRRLDGLPLAIELAAARTRALDPAQIAAGLKNRFALLPTGPRTAPRRQSTLARSFDWSYDLLSEPERTLLRQLSVFFGGFDVEAALAVCPGASLELLAALIDRSLIIVEGRGGQVEPRYRMLETVRQFAAEHLDEADEVESIRARHRDQYLRLAETAAPELFGPEQGRWYARLRSEQDNLRAALAWSQGQGEAEALARMVVALAQFWVGQGRFIEAQVWMDAAADRVEDIPPRWRAWIRLMQSILPIFLGDRGSLGETPALANEALALARAVGEQPVEGFALLVLGMVAGLVGGAEAMRPYLEEALPLARSSGFAQGFAQVFALGAFVMLRWFQSDPEEPRRLGEEAIAVAKAAGDRHGLLSARWLAGLTALIQGRLPDAAQLFDIAVAEGRETSDSMLSSCLLGLAWVAMFRGDFVPARAGVAESLAAEHELEAEGGLGMTIGPLSRWILSWMDLAGGGAVQTSDTLPGVVDAFRFSPFPRLAAVPLVVLAEAQLALGAHDKVQASLEEATSVARAGAMTWVLGRASLVLAKLRAREGDLREAESLTHKALSLGREAGDQLGLVDALELLGRLVAELGSPKEAVRLWAAADSLRAVLGYRFAVDRAGLEADLAQARQGLGPDDFAAGWAEGSKLSLEEAIAYAARGRGERRRPATGWASLTPSELEVVRLVGQHLSNPEIASRLFVSTSTVKTHLAHIFAKLGIDSRSKLATEASRRRIAQPQNSRTVTSTGNDSRRR